MIEIKSWNPVIPPDQTFPRPAFYFKPNEQFLKHVKEAGKTVRVKIHNSKSNYDNTELNAIIQNTAVFPNYRPNFFNETQYLWCILEADWTAYPLSNGIVEFLNIIENPQEAKDEHELKNSIKMLKALSDVREDYKRCNNLSDKQISYIFIMFFLIFLVFLTLKNK